MYRKVLLGILVLSVVGSLALAPVYAKIVGSAHDFKLQSWNTTGEICIVCHTPHNADATASAPLWNHALSTQTYTVYNKTDHPTLNATVGQPSASSKACLSCHDGTVALGSFGGNTGTTSITGDHNLGTNLNNDHPVSFTYDTTLAANDGGLEDPSTKTITTNVASGLTGKTIQAGMLIGNKLECGSCHDVHNDKGDAPTASSLLLVNNAGSALCLTCHKK